jgi:hypothetical protein
MTTGEKTMKRKIGKEVRTNQHWTNKEVQRLLAKSMDRSEKAVQVKLSKVLRQLAKPMKTVVTVSQESVDSWDKIVTCLDKENQATSDDSKNLIDRAIHKLRLHTWLYRLTWFLAITAAVLFGLIIERLL